MRDFYSFKNVYIEEKIKDHPNTIKILGKINKNNLIYVENTNTLIKETSRIIHPGERSQNLLLSSFKGELLQKCPGSHGHICCNYNVINQYIGCPIDCSYCILQSYLNQPFTIINTDTDTLFEHLHELHENVNDCKIRIGTGELGDSLVYDPITDFSEQYIDFFGKHKKFIFEFKTKTNFIGNILARENPGNIVVGFSVNPECITKSEEKNSTPLIERLKAAGELQKKGYMIALHFDPIIFMENWREEYNNLIEIIFRYVMPQKIIWISLGTFRYIPDLKTRMEFNYPDSRLLTGEFFENADKKFRYLKMIRQEIYKTIYNKLNTYGDNLNIYLCMESPDVWKRSLGKLPGDFDDKLLWSNPGRLCSCPASSTADRDMGR